MDVVKHQAYGRFNQYKGRLVTKAYKPKYGIDYIEVFTPMAWIDSGSMLISVYITVELDLTSVFLNRILEE